MKNLLTTFIAILVGMLVAMAIIIGIQTISSMIYPLPVGLDPMDKTQVEAFRAYISTAPMGMFIIVLLGYMVASFAGGFVATFIDKERMPIPIAAITVGAILTSAGISNLSAVPHPIWFAIINIPSFFIFAFLGSKMVKRNVPA